MRKDNESLVYELNQHARVARNDLGSLEGFLEILKQQVLVLHDNGGEYCSDDDDDGLRELREELRAIARSLTIACSTVATSQDDVRHLAQRVEEALSPAPHFASRTG